MKPETRTVIIAIHTALLVSVLIKLMDSCTAHGATIDQHIRLTSIQPAGTNMVIRFEAPRRRGSYLLWESADFRTWEPIGFVRADSRDRVFTVPRRRVGNYKVSWVGFGFGSNE